MPCRAIMKFRVRYGCMFEYGCDPPADTSASGLIGCRLLAAPYRKAPVDWASRTLGDGPVFAVAAAEVALAKCTWVGISELVSVWFCSPPCSPMMWPWP